MKCTEEQAESRPGEVACSVVLDTQGSIHGGNQGEGQVVDSSGEERQRYN